MENPVATRCDQNHAYWKESKVSQGCPFCLRAGLQHARDNWVVSAELELIVTNQKLAPTEIRIIRQFIAGAKQERKRR